MRKSPEQKEIEHLQKRLSALLKERDAALQDSSHFRWVSTKREKERDEALAEVERLREAARKVHALAEKTMQNAWCVGIAREALYDIHEITKGMVE